MGLCQSRLGQTEQAARSLTAALALDASLTFAKDCLEKLHSEPSS